MEPARVGRNVPVMPARLLTLLISALSALLIVVSPAFASLSDEVASGQAVASQLRGGTAECARLTDAQFEHLGEFTMDRMAGSRAAHEAMNERMAQAIGADNTDRMHQLMGRNFAGCSTDATSTNGAGAPMGPGMMGGSGPQSSSGWGMMGGQRWSWMHDGSWQHMSQDAWRTMAGTMMGAQYASPGDDGWSTGGVLGVVLGALLVGALLGVLVVRRGWHRRPPSAPSAA